METLPREIDFECDNLARESGPSPEASTILERMARCTYMIDQHRAGILINSRRLAELRAMLGALDQRR